ncbi:MAG: metalloregulator ArsR/SmtB family transcription factor [Pseudomonadota bacterium]
MDTLAAAERLAALGHEYRLAIFRLLVQAGPAGLNASAIGDALGLAPSALSFHLAHLSRVGLIEGQRESRFIHYSASFAAMGELLGFLTDNCCQGEPCLPVSGACAPACAPAGEARATTPARRARN